MQIKESKDKLTIELTPPKSPIARAILIFQVIIFFGLSTYFLIRILSNVRDNLGIAILFFIVVFIGAFLLGKKFFRAASHTEILEITTKQLVLIDKYIFSTEIATFSIPKISHLEFVGEEQFTKHPLEGDSLDYTGLGVRERAIQSFIADGTIEILYNGRARRFGKNIPSWESEEIITRIKKFTGSNLSAGDSVTQLLDELNQIENT